MEPPPGPRTSETLEALLARIRASRLLARAPLVMATSPLVAITSLAASGNASYALAVLALSIGVLGAMMEYIFLVLMYVLYENTIKGRATIASLLAPAASIGLYVSTIGMILAKRIVRRAGEYFSEAHVEDLGCKEPSTTSIILFFGAPLARFQECIINAILSRAANESPVYLGAVSNNGQEEPWGSNTGI